MDMHQAALYDQSMIEIHDNAGKIRTDFSESEIEKIPEAIRPLFWKLIECKIAEDDADAEMSDAIKHRHECVTARDAAVVALGELRKTSHVDELRKVIAARNSARDRGYY
jgi:hypothetical protein